MTTMTLDDQALLEALDSAIEPFDDSLSLSARKVYEAAREEGFPELFLADALSRLAATGALRWGIGDDGDFTVSLLARPVFPEIHIEAAKIRALRASTEAV